LVSWARKQSHLSKKLHTVPTLKPKGGKKAKTIEKKTQVFRERFYLVIQNVDLSDILKTQYPPPIEIPKKVTKKEISRLIQNTKTDKTPKIDGYPNRFLKALRDPLAEIIITVTNAY